MARANVSVGATYSGRSMDEDHSSLIALGREISTIKAEIVSIRAAIERIRETAEKLDARVETLAAMQNFIRGGVAASVFLFGLVAGGIITLLI